MSFTHSSGTLAPEGTALKPAQPRKSVRHLGSKGATTTIGNSTTKTLLFTSDPIDPEVLNTSTVFLFDLAGITTFNGATDDPDFSIEYDEGDGTAAIEIVSVVLNLSAASADAVIFKAMLKVVTTGASGKIFGVASVKGDNPGTEALMTTAAAGVTADLTGNAISATAVNGRFKVYAKFAVSGASTSLAVPVCTCQAIGN